MSKYWPVGDPFMNFFGKKVSQCRKKTERENPLGVFNIHFVAKHQKIEGGKILFSEKNLNAEKN